MKTIVSKFGGTSLANSSRFLKVKDIIMENEEERRYVVASAPGKSNSDDTKVTDLLYLSYDLANHNIAHQDTLEKVFDKYREIAAGCNLDIELEVHFEQIREDFVNLKSKDYIASRGEYLNAIILAELLGYDFVDAKDLIFFKENGLFDEERSYKALAKMQNEHKTAVIPGFYGSTADGKIKTFSRGGGDLTGSIVSRGVKTDLYENWTDVSGFLAADPRIVKNPQEIKVITYRELRELSYAGASVLHEEAIIPVTSAGIPIQIKNTFKPEDEGTLILPSAEGEPSGEITGVTGKKHFSIINIEKVQMNADKSFYRKLMSVLEVNNLVLEHMPTSIDSISLIVSDKQLAGNQETLVNEINAFCNPDKITISSGMSLITVVGRGIISSVGAAAKVFKSLADANVNIQIIVQGSSEMNIIVGVKTKHYEKAIKSIYNAFLG